MGNIAKIKGGYYIKARAIQNSEIMHAPPHVREIWDWILMQANHKDIKYMGRIIERGQCIRSYNDIQEGLKWKIGWRTNRYSKNDCETAMRWLKNHTMIHTQKTTRGMVITVVNYSLYQDPANYETDNEAYKKHTRSIQTTATINKNDKNVKNDKKLLHSELSSQIQKVFDIFYNSINPNINYGNKTSRKATEWLIKKYGFEKTLRTAEYSCSVQGDKYTPKITTPYQLKEKMADLMIFYKRNQSSGPTII